MTVNHHTVMKILIIFAAFTALASAVEWTDLRVKWSMLDSLLRFNSYFKIPRTADSAVSEGWVSVAGVNDHPVDVYCLPNDGRFCIITDSYGNIAGFQSSILASDIENKGIPYNPATIAAYKKKTMFNDVYWTTTVYTVDPKVIDAGGRSDMQGLTGTTGVWIEQGDSYMVVPRNVDTMRKTLDYHEENCISRMGTHYYYAMNETFNCEEFEPYFLLYKEGDLLGVGFQAFGKATTTKRNWYEWVPWFAIRPTIPNAPQCLVDWVYEYGLISVHVYFVEEPWKISC